MNELTSPTAARRIWERVAQSDDPAACWPWTGPIDAHGYGRGFYAGSRRMMGAHRAAYIVTNGPIVDGLTVDHECHNRDLSCMGGRACPHRRCCNPAHLSLKTNQDNLRASHRLNANRTHCKRGHAFAGPNLRIAKSGRRYCRTCSCINTTNYLRRKAAR